jgi:hypothetical protein
VKRRILISIFIVSVACALVLASRAGAARDALTGYQILSSSGSPFIIFYPPSAERMAREVEQLLNESVAEIAGELGLETIGAIKVVLVSNTKTYELLHQGKIPEWGIAFSDIDAQMLSINMDLVVRSPRPLSIVVRHELSHLLLAQRVEGSRIPTWFMEGLAMVQAGEWSFSDEWRLMTMAARRDIPYLEELRGPFPRSPDRATLYYSLSHFAVEELLHERPGAVMTLTAFIRDTGDFESAFASTFGMSTYDFAGRVYVEIDRRYRVPGTILNASPFWLAAALIFVAVYAVKRARSRRKLERWEQEEARTSRFWY